MNITVGGKRLIHAYHHYIMRLDLVQFHRLECNGYRFRKVTESDIDILKRGDFSIANMLPYLRREKQYATGLLFFEEKTDKPVGYIWVVRRGGNEMSYRIRQIDGLISCVCVFQEFRGHNIANLMLSEIVNLMKADGFGNVALGVNTDNEPAIHAYTKAGFVVTGEKKYIRVLRKNIPYHTV